MALFGDAFVQTLETLVQQRQQELAAMLGRPALPSGAADSPLRRKLALLMQIANGEVHVAHTTARAQEEIEQSLREFVDLLFGNVLRTHVTIPDDFWQTEAGILVSRVRWWLSPDDLITISNAAALAFGENTQANRMRIARAMDKGVLEWIPDPSVANPQQNRRVLRSQVERLRALNTLPE